MFRFKQFTINDHLSSMKVGTDAVLLGAWASLPSSGRVLDVGCGSGVISLMAAQRCPGALVTGIDIHVPSVQQARENAARSPFDNTEFIEGDFLRHPFPTLFDAIVSNPPYHTETLLAPDASRAAARNTAFLSFSAFVERAARLLVENGTLQVILPASAATQFHEECNRRHLSLTHLTQVRTTKKKAPKRVLMSFVKGQAETVTRDEIILLEDDGTRSGSYSKLCADFYL